MFPGYYRPTDDEYKDIWDRGLVILDTNALLNLFRYSSDTREAFLQVLRQKSDLLWIPNQVGLEFHRKRLSVVDDQRVAFTKIIDKTQSAIATITKEVGVMRDHPSLDLEDLKRTLTEALKPVESKVSDTQARYQSEVVDKGLHDKTLDEITSLYEGRVGAPYSVEELESIYAEGRDRYDRKVPPGYKDIDKPEPLRYGDLVLWKQILDKAEASTLPALFVTDDVKEDWWREFQGQKIGPRVELVDDYVAKSGQRIHFYTPQQFIEYAKALGAQVSEASLQEVVSVSTAQTEQGVRTSTDGVWISERKRRSPREDEVRRVRSALMDLSRAIADIERLLVSTNDPEKESGLTAELKDALRHKRALRSRLERIKSSGEWPEDETDEQSAIRYVIRRRLDAEDETENENDLAVR
ncbi:MAG: PIN-like domain-containing protein [Humibacter sp.]